MNINSKKWAAAEVASIFVLVMAGIWIGIGRPVVIAAVVISLVSIVVLGFVLRIKKANKELRECTKEERKSKKAEMIANYTELIGIGRWEKNEGKWYTGIRLTYLNFSQLWQVALGVAISLVIIVTVGLVINFGFWQVHDFWNKLDDRVFLYIYWGIVQQFLLQGYVTNRIYAIFTDNLDPRKYEARAAWRTAIISGTLFYIVHYPNPVLMITTLIFGAAGAIFFLKCRNIYLLGIAHGILAVAVKLCVAKGLVGGFRIGYHFWQQ